MIQPETLTTDDFSRLDEVDDRLFCSTDRFMFDPDSGTFHSAPVLTPQSLRESIVSR